MLKNEEKSDVKSRGQFKTMTILCLFDQITYTPQGVKMRC